MSPRNTLRLPNLLVIGAQKCGTTWLYERLRRHPDIFLSKTKELSFFGRQEARRDLEDYAENFLEAGSARYVGEATPGYFWACDRSRNFFGSGPRQLQLHTALAVRDALGADVRLILLLRHPVHRAVSAFMHHFKQGRIAARDRILDLQKRLLDFDFRYGVVEMGFYERHYWPWERVFGTDKMLVLFTDDVLVDPVSTLERVTAFLDIPLVDVEGAERMIHGGLKLAISDNTLTVDADDPETRETLYRNGLGETGFPRMHHEEILELQEIYGPDIAFVERRFGRPDLGWHVAPRLEDFLIPRAPNEQEDRARNVEQ